MHAEPVDISPLSVLGLTAGQAALYRDIVRAASVSRQRLAAPRGLASDELEAELRPLVDAGLVEAHDDVVRAAPPEVALAGLVAEQGRRLAAAESRLSRLRNLVPVLTAEHQLGHGGSGDSVEIERIRDADAPRLIRALSAGTTGDLMWFRPDQWRLAEGAEIDDWVVDLVRSGRRSRAIYPARVLEDAPGVVRRRAEAGEDVRVLAAVPMRLAVMGTSAALLSEQPDDRDGPRLVVRQEALVAALTLLFERLWERAVPVPGLDALAGGERHGDRRLLLDQLVAGAKDEQIARTLGLSLRTVRRRVAALLDELGAVSRFQAGVEAARRGWL